MALKITENGVSRDMTPAEEALYNASKPEIVNPAKARRLKELGINEERDRRAHLPYQINLTGYGSNPVWVQMATIEDQLNLSGIVDEARFRIDESNTTPIPYIDERNTIHNLTPSQVVELGRLTAARKSAIIFAARTEKDKADPDVGNVVWP